MDKKKQGLNELLEHKKRIQRMKTGVIIFLLTWMLALMLISVTLIAKVHSLQNQIDILTENTIRSQQIGRQQNQTAKLNKVASYETVANGENTQKKQDGSIDKAQDTANDENDKSQDDGGNAEKEQAALDPEDDEEAMKVYLTFDDGPSANTRRIMDILDKYGVKATFFVTGREDEESLALYKEISDRGHTIGMHSYSHRYDVIYSSRKEFRQDFELIKSRIEEATGKDCWLYRFPGGSSNHVSTKDMSTFIRFLNKRQITYFDWNVQCGDATTRPYSTKDLTDNVMNDIGKYHTSVVLMHDAANKPDTVEALPGIIKKIKATGAVLLPITEKTKVVQHVSAESVEN